MRLKRQASLCLFDDTSVDSLINQMVRDQFIRGVKSSKITEHILSSGNLTLNETVTKAEALKQAVADSEIICESKKSILAVQSSSSNFHNSRSMDRRRSNSHRSPSVKSVVCFKCKKKGHIAKNCFVGERNDRACFHCGKTNHQSSACFKKSTCSKCKKLGHTANVCRENNVHCLLGVDSDSVKGRLNYVSASFLSFPVEMLVDTGAAFSIVSLSFVKRNGLQSKMNKCEMSGIVADGRSLVIHNYLSGELSVNGCCMDVKLYVVDTHVDSILGMDLIPQLGLKIGECSGLVFALVPDI